MSNHTKIYEVYSVEVFTRLVEAVNEEVAEQYIKDGSTGFFTTGRSLDVTAKLVEPDSGDHTLIYYSKDHFPKPTYSKVFVKHGTKEELEAMASDNGLSYDGVGRYVSPKDPDFVVIIEKELYNSERTAYFLTTAQRYLNGGE